MKVKEKSQIFHYANVIPMEIMEKADIVNDHTRTFKERLSAAKDLATLNVFVDQILWNFEDDYMSSMMQNDEFVATRKATRSVL